MTDKEKIEENIRMAESFISEAKKCLSKAEDLRLLTTTLLSKHIDGKLK